MALEFNCSVFDTIPRDPAIGRGLCQGVSVFISRNATGPLMWTLHNVTRSTTDASPASSPLRGVSYRRL